MNASDKRSADGKAEVIRWTKLRHYLGVDSSDALGLAAEEAGPDRALVEWVAAAFRALRADGKNRALEREYAEIRDLAIAGLDHRIARSGRRADELFAPESEFLRHREVPGLARAEPLARLFDHLDRALDGSIARAAALGALLEGIEPSGPNGKLLGRYAQALRAQLKALAATPDDATAKARARQALAECAKLAGGPTGSSPAAPRRA